MLLRIATPIIVLGLLISSCQETQAQTSDTLLAVYNLVSNTFGQNQAKTIIRLAFHDAMGGTDGRLNEADSEHNGLLGTLSDLDELYSDNAAGKNCCCKIVPILVACLLYI